MPYKGLACVTRVSGIEERLTRYAVLPIQTLNIHRPAVEVLRMMAELVL